MASDTEQLILSISADTRQIQRALRRLEGDAKTAGQGIEKALSFSNDNASRSMRAMQADAKNLTFQLNDITQGLLGGQSPFQVMVQQGSQVSQVLTGAGGITNAVKLLGSSFLGLINPIALATSAVIFAIGYAVQYFTAAEEGSDKATKELEKHVDALKSIADAYGVLSPQAEAVLSKFLEWRKIQSVIKELQDGIAALRTENVSRLNSELDKFQGLRANLADQMGLSEANAAMINVRQAWAQLAADIEAGKSPIENATKLLAELDALEMKAPGAGAKAFADILRNQVLPALKDSNEAQKAATEIMKKLGEATGDAVEKQKEYNKAIETMRGIAQPTLTDAQKLMVEYGKAIANASTEQERLNALTELLAGIGRIAVEELDANIKSAADLIKKEEGFIPKAKWDVNAFRVGFGSDTYIDEMGRVQKVTKDTVITLEQANRDLSRRIGEFQATIRTQIGPDMWRSFTEQQQAALTSIAYNYGRLPTSIVEAIKKGDQGQVALAISNLSANPERRKREAQLFAGGSAAAGDALKAAEAAKTQAEKTAEANAKLQEMITTEQQEIALKEKINAINADAALKEDERAAAITRVTAEAAKEAEVEKLLAQAKEANITITPELIAQYNALAQAKVNAVLADQQIAVANKQAADAERQRVDALKQLNQQAQQMVSGAITGFIQDLRNGVDAGEAFNNMLNRIIDSLINMAVQMAVKSLFGGGGLGALFGVAHSGGIVGQTAFPQRRVDPRVFIGAPRMATGGLVGGEVPIIAHRGEMVIPKSMVGRGAPVQEIHTSLGDVNVDMSATGMVTANNEDAREFGKNVQRLIQLEMVRESRPGGLLRRVPG